MPDENPIPAAPNPIAGPEPASDRDGPGLVDPRTTRPGPEDTSEPTVSPVSGRSTAPEKGGDPQATDEPEFGATGLVGPRSKINDPLGP